jgi:ADP-ribose pyrophosphatase YjhB (NUDIX family)
MPTIGASAVVISSGEVLLIKRRDCEAWAVPGGKVEAGETVADTAIREVREETGIDIELTGLVGVYSSPRWHAGGNVSIVFAAIPRSRALTPQPEEVIEAGYFSPRDLPEPFVWWHRRWIRDTLEGVRGMACLQDRIWPWEADVSPGDLHRIFQESGMSPQAFFQKYLTRVAPVQERIEVDQATGSAGGP